MAVQNALRAGMAAVDKAAQEEVRAQLKSRPIMGWDEYGNPIYPTNDSGAVIIPAPRPPAPTPVSNEPEPAQPMTKHKLLDLAKAATADRGLNYGKPENNFERIAARWRVHIFNRFGIEVPIDPASVAIMMSDMKKARLENNITHLDSWVDDAGYVACGAEIAAKP